MVHEHVRRNGTLSDWTIVAAEGAYTRQKQQDTRSSSPPLPPPKSEGDESKETVPWMQRSITILVFGLILGAELAG
jgi:hypothetical protein